MCVRYHMSVGCRRSSNSRRARCLTIFCHRPSNQRRCHASTNHLLYKFGFWRWCWPPQNRDERLSAKLSVMLGTVGGVWGRTLNAAAAVSGREVAHGIHSTTSGHPPGNICTGYGMPRLAWHLAGNGTGPTERASLRHKSPSLQLLPSARSLPVTLWRTKAECPGRAKPTFSSAVFRWHFDTRAACVVLDPSCLRP
ncbi:hypothetical protein PsYK624_059140 [Phanerochaete sordida]|uniref:Uncharacterized protein n=1 Tax=Phanerochaete sordida TaxID=48140 RepID=A0A9P3G7S8_9APHY|nr:hypothetical protein PsYK624_059140 [Phanerochaete sordida]